MKKRKVTKKITRKTTKSTKKTVRKTRKKVGKWTYNDTRDYRFDPDMFKL